VLEASRLFQSCLRLSLTQSVLAMFRAWRALAVIMAKPKLQQRRFSIAIILAARKARESRRLERYEDDLRLELEKATRHST
jgi:hypothetical protein